MCVIFVADQGVRVTEEMVRLGYFRNGSGAGAAWRHKGEVVWRKGMNLEEVQGLNKELPFPYVLHFRLPSHGTATGPQACHPFEVSNDASYRLSGLAPNGVLFHNGLWTDWKNKLADAAVRGGWHLPGGPYSDSRGLAIMASRIGAGYLELINEKVIWFTKDEVQIFGEGWVEKNGIMCSNLSWESVGSSGGRGQVMGFIPVSTHPNGTTSSTEGSGGVPRDPSFRGNGPQGSSQEGTHQQKEVQQGDATAVREGMAEPGDKKRLILFEGEEACMVCEAAIGKVVKFTNTGRMIRCWDCWTAFNKTETETSLARCEFCWSETAKHRTRREGKRICRVCWIKKDRPPVDAYPAVAATH